ncbi:MAG: hypothetical protein U1E49_09150 [Hyphomicrobiaceae bacterium]
MKSLVFMMMLSMFLVSAGVVYLSINRDPLGGVPHVDVPLDPAPPEQAAAAPAAPAADTATADPAGVDPAASDPAASDPAALTIGAPSTEANTNSDEPLTVTTFPIPDPNAPATAGDAAATTDTGQ